MPDIKLIKRRNYIDPWRIGETESWLSDMSAQGLHLKNIGILYHFERGEPRTYRYRIEFSIEDREQIQLYAESGWEFVADRSSFANTSGYFVFRAPESVDIPELHTDTAELSLIFGKFKRNITINSVSNCCFLLFMFYVVNLVRQQSGGSGLVFFLNRGAVLALLLFYDLCILVIGVLKTISVWKLTRALKEGKSIEHGNKWRKSYRIGKLCFVVFTLMTVLLTLLVIPEYL